MKILVLLLLSVALVGCDAEKKHTEFITKCTGAGFNEGQCEFLFAMAEQSGSDSSSDEAAAVSTAVDVSVGVGAGTRR